MRFVYCLCFGRTIKQVEEEADGGDASSWPKLRVQIFVISELIKSIRNTGVGLVQSTIGLLLRAHSAPKDLYSKLNELGLCRAYRTGLREKMSNFVDSVREGLGKGMAFTQWEHLLVIFDNIGFKRGGTASRVGYLQMTLLIMVRATRELLVEWKIIPDPTKEILGDILNRERKKWPAIDEEEDITYEKFVKYSIGYNLENEERIMTTPEDHLDFLAATSFKDLELMFEALKPYGLGAYDRAEQMLESNSVRWIESIPSCYGRQMPQNQNDDDAIESPLESDDLSPAYKDFLDVNNAWMDMAMAEDLTEMSTLVKIKDYVLQFDDYARDDEKIEKRFTEWGVVPI